jgi:L-ascorbate metabolism protein UlaG (beta-lactamase superfamily)
VKKENTEVVEGIGEKIVKGVSIKGFRSFHDESEGRKRGKNTIFKFLFEGMKFCHLGDLGHQLDDETAKEIGQVDFLFIPIGGNFTIDARKAMKVCEKIEPKVIIPMHYKIGGLSLPIEGVDRFLDIAKEKYEISHVSNEIDMEKEDLPEKTEVWVFNL